MIRYRSAITGMYVSKKYAMKHPKTTVSENSLQRSVIWFKKLFKKKK